ncbi:SsrA-binding protein SmpB [Patescibacteria group bacterium]|nr:SsrA-binding protein SmpB [Patescibacteria group bacterium]
MSKLLVKNRKANFEYEILEKFEAGIVLFGHEVKSLKTGGGNLTGSYLTIKNGELWLEKMNIALYEKATLPIYEPTRSRKLLVRKKEIDQLTGALNTQGVTLIPLSCILKNNRIKIEFALARGKKKYDKRESIKKRDQERRIQREINR